MAYRSSGADNDGMVSNLKRELRPIICVFRHTSVCMVQIAKSSYEVLWNSVFLLSGDHMMLELEGL